MKDLIEEIKKLKKERKAVILVHNYQPPEIQDIADFLGDSLELSRMASKTEAKVIVFCGVHFMAETASILCPDKKVLMPDIDSGCPMADMITAEGLRELKLKYPKAIVVGYVNTPAEVKAELDICCTSANAVSIISKLKDSDEIIFVPDKYLADYVSKKTGRRLIVWEGFCPIHVEILASDVTKQIRLHPQAKVIVHPECTPEVISLADAALSTSQMCRYVAGEKDSEFIIGTEIGLLYKLQKDNPNKKFYAVTDSAICPDMKKITYEKILWSLEELKDEVKIPEKIRIKAKRAIDKMLEIL